jgi:AraC family transcriptional regulator
VEIAIDTGFGSQANFTRVFRKRTGLTPGQYRALFTAW